MSEALEKADQKASEGRRSKKTAVIEVRSDWCKKCGICITTCPTDVYDADDDGMPLISRPEKCILCDLCVLKCPDFAITVRSEDNGQ